MMCYHHGRVLALVAEGRLDPGRAGGDEVYRLTRRAAAWASLLGPGQTVGVEARVHGCTDVPSALLARARVRDAVCDSVSDARRASATASCPEVRNLLLPGNKPRRQVSPCGTHCQSLSRGCTH